MACGFRAQIAARADPRGMWVAEVIWVLVGACVWYRQGLVPFHDMLAHLAPMQTTVVLMVIVAHVMTYGGVNMPHPVAPV